MTSRERQIYELLKANRNHIEINANTGKVRLRIELPEVQQKIMQKVKDMNK